MRTLNRVLVLATLAAFIPALPAHAGTGGYQTPPLSTKSLDSIFGQPPPQPAFFPSPTAFMPLTV